MIDACFSGLILFARPPGRGICCDRAAGGERSSVSDRDAREYGDDEEVGAKRSGGREVRVRERCEDDR